MCMREYSQEIFAQKTPYLQWLKAQETALEKQYGQEFDQDALGKQIHTLPFCSCMDRLQEYEEFRADTVYLFVRKGGKLSKYAKAVFAEVFFAGNVLDKTNVLFAYADEDYQGSLEALYRIEEHAFDQSVTAPYLSDRDCGNVPLCACYRGEPWFKPDFSPDTLASFFYVGSVFAVRGSGILEIRAEYGEAIDIYEFAYRIFMRALDRKMQGGTEGIVHIPKVLYTNGSLEDARRMECSDTIRALHRTANQAPGISLNIDSDKVSIVIPSKDNACVLEKCLKNLVYNTNYGCYEIIIVDNGSNEEQKKCITGMIDALKREKRDLTIEYLYQESTFNFSAMCNQGARAAKGRYLLFLNDDIEVMDTDKDWLGKMVMYAAKAHVGAVGAKLYYPRCPGDNECYRIQHAGITNMGIGPAHKLGGMADKGCLYHGHNTQNYDMLAVTAACLLIRKKVFDEAGGFDESFPVAYNDVALCFLLYQKGYLNVQVNEAVLLHHESLSRGQDTSPEKQRRLQGEKQKLYQKYPLLNARDPFYSQNLVQWKKDATYNTGYLYDFDHDVTPLLLAGNGEDERRKRAIFKKYDTRRFLHTKSKIAAKFYDKLTRFDAVLLQIDAVRYGEGIAAGQTADNTITKYITIEGWSAVRRTDNAKIPRKLWLINMVRNADYRTVYELEIAPKLREDVQAFLSEGEGAAGKTRNAALSGIQASIRESALKPGHYCVGVLYGDRLVCDTKEYVDIPGSNVGRQKGIGRSDANDKRDGGHKTE